MVNIRRRRRAPRDLPTPRIGKGGQGVVFGAGTSHARVPDEQPEVDGSLRFGEGGEGVVFGAGTPHARVLDEQHEVAGSAPPTLALARGPAPKTTPSPPSAPRTNE